MKIATDVMKQVYLMKFAVLLRSARFEIGFFHEKTKHPDCYTLIFNMGHVIVAYKYLELKYVKLELINS